jgi:hypothetical protein
MSATLRSLTTLRTSTRHGKSSIGRRICSHNAKFPSTHVTCRLLIQSAPISQSQAFWNMRKTGSSPHWTVRIDSALQADVSSTWSCPLISPNYSANPAIGCLSTEGKGSVSETQAVPGTSYSRFGNHNIWSYATIRGDVIRRGATRRETSESGRWHSGVMWEHQVRYLSAPKTWHFSTPSFATPCWHYQWHATMGYRQVNTMVIRFSPNPGREAACWEQQYK